MATDSTLLGGLLESRVEVVFLAVDFPIDIVEGLPAQGSSTGATYKA